MSFTPQQLKDFAAYDAVRQSNNWNMFSAQAREASGLERIEYLFVMEHYDELKEATEKEMT